MENRAFNISLISLFLSFSFNTLFSYTEGGTDLNDLLNKAANGDTVAMNNIGINYAKLYEKTLDKSHLVKSVVWYNKAAEGGNSYGYLNIADSFRNLPRESPLLINKTAIDYYKDAAKLGNGSALKSLWSEYYFDKPFEFIDFVYENYSRLNNAHKFFSSLAEVNKSLLDKFPEVWNNLKFLEIRDFLYIYGYINLPTEVEIEQKALGTNEPIVLSVYDLYNSYLQNCDYNKLKFGIKSLYAQNNKLKSGSKSLHAQNKIVNTLYYDRFMPYLLFKIGLISLEENDIKTYELIQRKLSEITERIKPYYWSGDAPINGFIGNRKREIDSEDYFLQVCSYTDILAVNYVGNNGEFTINNYYNHSGLNDQVYPFEDETLSNSEEIIQKHLVCFQYFYTRANYGLAEFHLSKALSVIQLSTSVNLKFKIAESYLELYSAMGRWKTYKRLENILFKDSTLFSKIYPYYYLSFNLSLINSSLALGDLHSTKFYINQLKEYLLEVNLSLPYNLNLELVVAENTVRIFEGEYLSREELTRIFKKNVLANPFQKIGFSIAGKNNISANYVKSMIFLFSTLSKAMNGMALEVSELDFLSKGSFSNTVFNLDSDKFTKEIMDDFELSFQILYEICYIYSIEADELSENKIAQSLENLISIIRKITAKGFSKYSYGQDAALVQYTIIESILFKKLYDTNTSNNRQIIALLIEFFQLTEGNQVDYITTLNNLSSSKNEEYAHIALDYVSILKNREQIVLNIIDNSNSSMSSFLSDEKYENLHEDFFLRNNNLRRVLDRLNENVDFYYDYLNEGNNYFFKNHFTSRSLSVDKIKLALSEDEILYHIRAASLLGSLYTCKIFLKNDNSFIKLEQFDQLSYQNAYSQFWHNIENKVDIKFDENINILHDVYFDEYFQAKDKIHVHFRGNEFFSLDLLPCRDFSEDEGRGKFLFQDFNISYLPSLFTINGDALTNANSYLGMGDAIYQKESDSSNDLASIFTLRSGIGAEGLLLDNLPDTRIELNECAEYFNKSNSEIYFGSKASELNLRESLQKDFDVIHLAAHGITRQHSIDGFYPSIILTKKDLSDNFNDGYLNSFDIGTIRTNANLVYLSACTTLIDTDGQQSEWGLASSFINAGAKNCIGANWEVESSSASYFARKFFEKYSVCGNVSESINFARNQCLLHSVYYHPYYWGPYQHLTSLHAIIKKPKNHLHEYDIFEVPDSILKLEKIESINGSIFLSGATWDNDNQMEGDLIFLKFNNGKLERFECEDDVGYRFIKASEDRLLTTAYKQLKNQSPGLKYDTQNLLFGYVDINEGNFIITDQQNNHAKLQGRYIGVRSIDSVGNHHYLMAEDINYSEGMLQIKLDSGFKIESITKVPDSEYGLYYNYDYYFLKNSILAISASPIEVNRGYGLVKYFFETYDLGFKNYKYLGNLKAEQFIGYFEYDDEPIILFRDEKRGINYLNLFTNKSELIESLPFQTYHKFDYITLENGDVYILVTGASLIGNSNFYLDESEAHFKELNYDKTLQNVSNLSIVYKYSGSEFEKVLTYKPLLGVNRGIYKIEAVGNDLFFINSVTKDSISISSLK